MTQTIIKDDLFFHSSHGVCRVSGIQNPRAAQGCSYILSPLARDRGKARFVIDREAFEASGFNRLTSPAEGQAVLEYFRTGKSTFKKDTEIWRRAQLIRKESLSRTLGADGRKRQEIERAIKGLVKELACVLETPIEEISKKIKDSLSRKAVMNVVVLNAFLRNEKEESS